MYACQYNGTWRRGKPHGQGKLTWPSSGAYYQGQVEEGLPHGFGTFVGARGDAYKGQWLSGWMHGLGTFIWSDKSKYSGYWNNGLFQGTGLFTWPNGVALSGYWDKGEPALQGYFTLPDGVSLGILWTECEQLTNTSQDLHWQKPGVLYRGQWEKGKPRRQGTFDYHPYGTNNAYEIDWSAIVARKMLSVHRGNISLLDGTNKTKLVGRSLDQAAGALAPSYSIEKYSASLIIATKDSPNGSLGCESVGSNESVTLQCELSTLSLYL